MPSECLLEKPACWEQKEVSARIAAENMNWRMGHCSNVQVTLCTTSSLEGCTRVWNLIGCAKIASAPRLRAHQSDIAC